ncbi:methyltransferase [Actinotignum sanguinis]|uniref:class I SAM-dependent methyltransferase n=1 Tax=Actinotignum sanguinis TaxID=1445614 RepID=UPI000F7E574E|nr:methyltransferase [Actinotignum sanguinis]MDY5148563.1 methyltransferase [Actinotignum sanguinis]RTE51453.1 methyltransferase [Actinotignum sanguinis]
MTSHYFSEHPDTASNARAMEVTIRGRAYSVTVDDGVFSGNGLDKGTAVLLRKVPEPELEPGDIAVDLGCGWGPITLALAAETPRVIGVDVNERARELTRINLEANGLHGDVLTPGEALERLGEKSIRLLWSNPPIRIGKAALHELLATWLDRLAADGEAYLVVQKNLGADSLAAWLAGEGYLCEKIGSSKGFRVLRVRRS